MDIMEKALAPLNWYTFIEKYYDDTYAVCRVNMINEIKLFLNCIKDPAIKPDLYPYKKL